MFEKCMVVKTAITRAKPTGTDSGKSRVSVTCAGSLWPFGHGYANVRVVATLVARTMHGKLEQVSNCQGLKNTIRQG
jgi:hypothetical protein